MGGGGKVSEFEVRGRAVEIEEEGLGGVGDGAEAGGVGRFGEAVLFLCEVV